MAHARATLRNGSAPIDEPRPAASSSSSGPSQAEKAVDDVPRGVHGFAFANTFLPNPLSPDDPDGREEILRRYRLTFRERLEFCEWNILCVGSGSSMHRIDVRRSTVNLGTGAVSLLLGNTFEWSGQRALGTVFFLLNLVVFIINVGLQCARAWLHPRAFRASVSNPAEALFMPTAVLAFATIFVDMTVYATPYVGFWLTKTLLVVWFCYGFTALAVAGVLQWALYDQQRDLITVTPAECLPVLPFMLTGTLGSALALQLPDYEASYCIIISYMIQGGYYLIALQKLTVWMHRNIRLGHPSDKRIVPIFLMAVGPPGFTAYAFLTLGERAVTVFASQGILPLLGPDVGRLVLGGSVVLSLAFFGQCTWYIAATLIMWVKPMLVTRRVEWGMAWCVRTIS